MVVKSVLMLADEMVAMKVDKKVALKAVLWAVKMVERKGDPMVANWVEWMVDKRVG